MSGGYFTSQTETTGVDPDGLDDHEIDAETVALEEETLGPLTDYFASLEHQARRCYEVASQARGRGIDPEPEPEIPFAEDLASRVEALVGPEGVAERIRELADELGREELALTVSSEVAGGRFTEFEGPEQALDGAIRTGLAILTEGILVAPLEGVAQVKIRENEDGTRYADVYFAGPIRAAGGTGQALSVLIADVVRRELGLDAYQATRAEVERFKEEIPAYKKSANLQYTPDAGEIEAIVANLPVGVNGEGTEQEEVSGQRDLPRVETNQLRGGACLVIAEGMTLKASKIQKHVDNLGLEGWGFLDDFLDRSKGEDDAGEEGEGANGIQPVKTFIKELTAGRPVLAHPSAPGGFRLRYGRSRTAGLAATAIHPALCGLADDFLAVGTQLKIERPGKGTLVTPCDTIEPPIARLDDGTVTEVHTYDAAVELADRVDEIVDLGEMLVPFGEFLENNKPLPPSSWCTEWWERLLEDRDIQPPAVPDDAAAAAFRFAERTGTPLAPRFTLLWHDISIEELSTLADAVREASWEEDRLRLETGEEVKRILEVLGATHTVDEGPSGRVIVLDERTSLPVVRGTGHRVQEGAIARVDEIDPADGEVLDVVSELSGVQVKAKAPCRIGARMGRPEKAAERQMSPPVHGLFPLGGAGGLQRLIKDAAKKGEIGSEDRRSFDAIEAGVRRCPECPETETLRLACPECGTRTQPQQAAPRAQTVPLAELVDEALERLGEQKIDPNTKGVKGLISETKLPEPLEKAILRAKRDVWVFKDGTCRYDMTDLAITHVRPAEIGTPVETMRELGYTHDVDGDELTDPDQLVEVKPQDVVVNEDALAYLARVAQFVDDELTRLYGMKPYYDLAGPEDLIGELAVGLAPHTSGGVLCRIIGSTKAAGHWGHPYFHAAKRRNCLHPDSEVHVASGTGPERTTLLDLFDRTPGPAETVDDVGTQAKEPDGLEILSVDPSSGAVEPRTIDRVYRAPAPDHLLEIQTASGRSVLATPDHRMHVVEGGEIVKRTLRDLEPGDALAFPGRVPSPAPHDEAIDLLREIDPDEVDGVMVRGLGAYLQKLIGTHGGLKAAASSAGLSMKALDNYRRRDSIPLGNLRPMVESLDISLADLPADLSLAAKRDAVELPRVIPFSPAFSRLIGYYLAEGHARADPGRCYQVSLAMTEEEMVRDVQACAETALGLSPVHDGKAVTLSGRLVHHLFTAILALGSNAHEKRIPGRIAQLPADRTAELLSAYFAGDGSVERGRLHVSCHSVSEGLLRDIGLQLAQRGIHYRLREETRAAGGAARAFYEEHRDEVPTFTAHRLSIRSDHALTFLDEIGFALNRKQDDLDAVRDKVRGNRFEQGPGDLIIDRIDAVEIVEHDGRWVYDLEVEGHHNYLVNDLLLTSNCDGDEDCLMLLMDGLINFSRWYLPDRRGGQMDAPLTLSIRVDPEEIDSEAHNVDCSQAYPLAFYEATEQIPGPKELVHLVEMVEDRLGRPEQYHSIRFTHDTSRIDDGPALSAYKTIESMMEKMEGQLALGDKIRAVDAGDVASRVICDHFLPDIQGNLNAFTRQTVRCAKCNAKYRRVPLSGRCTKCKNTLTMTVHEAGVKKYVQMAQDVAESYDVDTYTRQRLQLIEDALESLFENDKVKKAKLSDFL